MSALRPTEGGDTTERPQHPQHQPADVSPDLTGPVLWTLAASRAELTIADGLPRRIGIELSKMLDGWYGEPAVALVQVTAQTVSTLTQRNGPGALRLLGTAKQLLIELVSHTEPAPRLGTVTALTALEQRAGSTGQYRTLGESGRLHVHWATLVLPDSVWPAALPQAKPAHDVWS